MNGRTNVAQAEFSPKPGGLRTFLGTTCAAVGPPAVTAAMVEVEVVKRLPAVSVGLAPKTSTLVNVQTIMWVQTPTQRQLGAFALLGQNVAVAIVVKRVAWTFGDGAATTAQSPGKAYDPAGDPCTTPTCADYFGHVYTRTGSVPISATVSWTASFRVDGGPVVAIPDVVTGPASTARLTVQQARSVLVPDPGH